MNFSKRNTLRDTLLGKASQRQADPSGLKLEYADYVMKMVNEEMREVLLVSPINEATFAATFFALSYLGHINKRPITLVLDTMGGEITSGLAMFDKIASMTKRVPVDILVTGACMSMGAVVLQAGRKRIATENCSLMLHQLRGVNEGELGELRDRHRYMEQTQRVLSDIICKRSGMPLKQINKLTERKDYYITAEEALDLNLIDAIEGRKR